MTQKFKIGDVVKLKSGGPIMTIEEYPIIQSFMGGQISEETVVCVWVDSKKEVQEGKFHQDSLVKENS